MTSVFNPDGSYKEGYRKELNRKILHTFHGYVCRDKKKEKFLKYKSYDEFIDFDDVLKNLKPIKKEGNNSMSRGRPPKQKQPNQETEKTMNEALQGNVNKNDSVEQIFEAVRDGQEILVDSIQSEVKISKPVIKNTKSYRFKDLESLRGLNELVVILSFFTKRLYENDIINLNTEELKVLDKDNINPSQTYLLILKIIINRFLEKGLLDFTDEEFYNIPNKYKEFLIY